MPPASEKQMLEFLGIDSWRHLSKDNFLQFASAVHDADPTVAIEAIRQFPHFTSLVLGAFEQHRAETSSLLEGNSTALANLQNTHEAWLAILTAELNRPDLDDERRVEIINLFREAVASQAAVIGKNQSFLLNVHKLNVAAFVGVAAIGAVALGGKFLLKRP